MERSHTSKNPITLFLGITGIILLAAYVNIALPDTGVTILGFFLLLVITIACLGMYITRNTRHVVVLTLGVTLYLGLRFIGLRHPIYGILLVASIVALEYVWKDNS